MTLRNPPQEYIVCCISLWYTIQHRTNESGDIVLIELTYRGTEKSKRGIAPYGKIQHKQTYRIADDDPKTIAAKLENEALPFLVNVDKKADLPQPLRNKILILRLIWELNKHDIFARCSISLHTQKKYEKTAELIFAVTEDTPWYDCTPANFQQAFTERYSIDQCRKINNLLREIFASQVARGFFMDEKCPNPWYEDLYKKRDHHYNANSELRKRGTIHSYSDTQVKIILHYCLSNDKDSRNTQMIKLSILLLMYQELSVGELVSLEYTDIRQSETHLGLYIIQIHRYSRNGSREEYPVNSVKRRKVPLSQQIAEKLLVLPSYGTSKFVFEHPSSRKDPMPAKKLKKKINEVLEDLIEISGVHDTPVKMLYNTGKARKSMTGFEEDALRHLLGLVPQSMQSKHYSDHECDDEQARKAHMLTRDMAPRVTTRMPETQTWTPKKCTDSYTETLPSTSQFITIQIPPIPHDKFYEVELGMPGGADVYTKLKESTDT